MKSQVTTKETAERLKESQIEGTATTFSNMKGTGGVLTKEAFEDAIKLLTDPERLKAQEKAMYERAVSMEFGFKVLRKAEEMELITINQSMRLSLTIHNEGILLLSEEMAEILEPAIKEVKKTFTL